MVWQPSDRGRLKNRTNHQTTDERLVFKLKKYLHIHEFIKCKQNIIDTARIVCGAGSMKRSSVRPSPSVCLSHLSPAAALCNGFPTEHTLRARDIDEKLRAPALRTNCKRDQQ